MGELLIALKTRNWNPIYKNYSKVACLKTKTRENWFLIIHPTHSIKKINLLKRDVSLNHPKRSLQQYFAKLDLKNNLKRDWHSFMISSSDIPMLTSNPF